MAKILIIGATFSKNQGSAAMLTSTINTLKRVISDSEFIVLSPFPKSDLQNYSIENVNVKGYSGGKIKIPFRFFQALISRMLHMPLFFNDGILKMYADSDIIIDLSGDGFTDDNGIMGSVLSCYDILLCKLLNRQFVIYAQSIGVFKTKLTIMLSKFCLNQVDLLIVRDKVTNDYLQEIGVTNKIYFTADSAFLLDAASNERVSEILIKENIYTDERPIIGFSVSQHIYNLEIKYPMGDSDVSYISLMAKVINYLIDKLNAIIVFIPHVTNDESPVDDRFVADRICDLLENIDNVRRINNLYRAEELKGIIGQCDLFIGARMHANIAATSMCVPTLAIAYSHKTIGIMEMLGMEYYVLDYRTMNFSDFASRLDNLWNEKENIKERLALNIQTLKERAFYNSILVKELLNSLDNEP